MKLDNADEQAAQVRRELDSRLSAAEDMMRVSVILLGTIYEFYFHSEIYDAELL
jgi:hypothetical protein